MYFRMMPLDYEDRFPIYQLNFGETEIWTPESRGRFFLQYYRLLSNLGQTDELFAFRMQLIGTEFEHVSEALFEFIKALIDSGVSGDR